MLRRIMIATMLFAATTAGQASEVEIALSDEMADILFAERTAASGSQSSRYGGGILYNEDSDILATLFLQANNRGDGRWQPVSFGVGAKAYAAELDGPSETIAALGVGGDIGIGIPASIPMTVILQGFVTPNITTAGDAERISEAMLRLEAEVTRGANAFIGYRRIKVHSDDFSDINLDKGLHAGIRVAF